MSAAGVGRAQYQGEEQHDCTQALSLFSRPFLAAISWYRNRISPLSAPRCKYYPTCSQYAYTAIERFGAWRGLALAGLRLLRCQPWSTGGIDDVPMKFSLCYRFRWSKAHEEPRLEPLAATEPAPTALVGPRVASGKETI